ncbi:unnamed protein product [Fructobacillus tropaeoli]|nr:unnamed protein product [Fructobacillus tropaeoli]
MQYGQQYDQGHWYLFDSQSGAMQYGRQYIADQNKWVLYDRNDGTMQYGQQYDQGHWYLFDSQSGAMQYGWQQLPQGRVYYDQHDGTIEYGTKFIDGVEYSFNIYNGAQETSYRQIMSPNVYTYGGPGLCLQYVDDAFNIYSNRSYSAKVAADKAGRASTMHYNDQFPVGIKVPVYWNLVSKDDGINYGHIAIWDGQGGFYWEGNNSSLPNYFTRDEMQQIMNGTRPVNGHYLTENWYTPVLIGWSTSLEGTVIAE